MPYLKYSQHVPAGTIFRVELSNSADVHLVDMANLTRFHFGESFYSHAGGRAIRTPVYVQVPYVGEWHVIVHGTSVAATFSTIFP